MQKQQVSIRVDVKVLERIDSLVEAVYRKDPGRLPRVTRSNLLEMAVLEGLPGLETKYLSVASSIATST